MLETTYDYRSKRGEIIVCEGACLVDRGLKIIRKDKRWTYSQSNSLSNRPSLNRGRRVMIFLLFTCYHATNGPHIGHVMKKVVGGPLSLDYFVMFTYLSMFNVHLNACFGQGRREEICLNQFCHTINSQHGFTKSEKGR